MNNVLSSAQLTSGGFILGCQNQKRKRATNQMLLENIANGMPGSFPNLICNYLIALLIDQMIL